MKTSDIREFRGYPVLLRRLAFQGAEIQLLGPANYDALLDDPEVAARFERDEYMPYWAELWPAALLLAAEVASWPRVDASSGTGRSDRGPTDPPTVLELGSGLGLVGLVAAARGYRVIISDYDEDALAFAMESARQNQLPAPEIRAVDWRRQYPDLSVDRIVAADVLYETRNLRPIAEFVYRHLTEAGVALLSDRNRTTADAFDGIARHCGLAVATVPVVLHETAMAPGETRAFGPLLKPAESSAGVAPEFEETEGDADRKRQITIDGRIFVLRRKRRSRDASSPTG